MINNSQRNSNKNLSVPYYPTITIIFRVNSKRKFSQIVIMIVASFPYKLLPSASSNVCCAFLQVIFNNQSEHWLRENFLLEFTLKVMVIVRQYGMKRILLKFLWLIFITLKIIISITIKYEICVINFTKLYSKINQTYFIFYCDTYYYF
jgi:hypothetical protein